MTRGRGKGKKRVLPGLRNDDVVEGGVTFAEAGEADLDDHARGTLLWKMGMGKRWKGEVGSDRAELGRIHCCCLAPKMKSCSSVKSEHFLLIVCPNGKYSFPSAVKVDDYRLDCDDSIEKRC